MEIFKRGFGFESYESSDVAIIKYFLTILCLLAALLYGFFGLYYYFIGAKLALYFSVIQVPLSLLLFVICRNGTATTVRVIYSLLVIGVLLLHAIITYSFGESGSILIVIAAILPIHIFNIFKLRSVVLIDLALIIALNIVNWIQLNIPPLYVFTFSSLYKFSVLNSCVLVCIFELFASYLIQSAINQERQQQLTKSILDASIDALTGLGNRRMLDKYQQDILMLSSNSRSMCVAIIDIDYFKNINDTYGHANGDLVLINLAKFMRSQFRKQDLLIRWGGEEFLLLLWDTNLNQAKAIMEKFQQNLRNFPIEIENEKIYIEVTIGVCKHDNKALLEQTIEIADQLMYNGKLAGRNTIVMAPDY